MNFNIVGKAIKGFFGGANSIVQTFTGSKKDRDSYSHKENTQTQKTYAAEFHQRNNRTLFDSFCDGINRLPRPIFVFLIVFYFVLSYVNPEEFQVLNIGLSTVPENMWVTLGTIIIFYFGARELYKHRENKMSIDPEEFNKMQQQIQEIRQFKKDNEDLENFKKDANSFMDDLDNPSISEWLKNDKKDR